MSQVGESYQRASIEYPNFSIVTYAWGRIILPTSINRIFKLGYGHLCLREENLIKWSQYVIQTWLYIVTYVWGRTILPTGLNRISKLGYGHLCLREENLTNESQCDIQTSLLLPMSEGGESYQRVSIGYPNLAIVTYVPGRRILPKGLNRISKLLYSHLCLR